MRRPAVQTLLVMPTYNERDNLTPLLEDIHQRAPDLDLLVIDDGSPDGTGNVADELAQHVPLTVIHRARKLGIGNAHKAGLRYAIEHGYSFVMTMDADFSHSPEHLLPMLRDAQHADLVIGSRYVKGGGIDRMAAHRWLLTKAAHWLTTYLLDLPYDCSSGLRLYRVDMVRRVDRRLTPSDGHAFLIEMVFHIKRQGGTIVESPITFRPRRFGSSKVSAAEAVRIAAALIRLSLQRLRSRRPDRSRQ